MNTEVIRSKLVQSWMVLPTSYILLCAEVASLCKVCGCVSKHMNANWAIFLQSFRYIPTRVSEKIVVDVYYCLQTCKSVVNMAVMGQALEKRLMVIPATGIQQYPSLIVYYGSALCKQVNVCQVSGPYLCAKFQTYTYKGVLRYWDSN